MKGGGMAYKQQLEIVNSVGLDDALVTGVARRHNVTRR